MYVHRILPDTRLADPSSTVLLALAFSAIVFRHRGHKGRLIQVLVRDGGLYYVALTGT